MAGGHGIDGQDRLRFERDLGAKPWDNHHRVHRALFRAADFDPWCDPFDRLSRRCDGLARTDRQPAVYPHPVRILSWADSVGRIVVARPESAYAAAVPALKALLPPSRRREISVEIT